MSDAFARPLRLLAAVLGMPLACACSSVQDASLQMANWITPYRIEIVQGNFVSREQVEALRPGLTRVQVREILGTPLVESLFHADRWDYVFTLKRDGVATQLRKLAVFFKDDRLERHEGDPMPSEAEFAATLTPARSSGAKLPVLEVDLGPAAAAATPAASAPAAAARPSAAAPRVYPPLEGGGTPAR